MAEKLHKEKKLSDAFQKNYLKISDQSHVYEHFDFEEKKE